MKTWLDRFRWIVVYEFHIYMLLCDKLKDCLKKSFGPILTAITSQITSLQEKRSESYSTLSTEHRTQMNLAQMKKMKAACTLEYSLK